MKKSDDCRIDEAAGGRIVLELDGATASALIRDLARAAHELKRSAFGRRDLDERFGLLRLGNRLLAVCCDLEGRR